MLMTVQPIGKANKLVSSERMYVSTERIGNFKSDNRTNLVVKRTCMYFLSSQMNKLKESNERKHASNECIDVFVAELIEVIRTNFGSNERK